MIDSGNARTYRGDRSSLHCNNLRSDEGHGDEEHCDRPGYQAYRGNDLQTNTTALCVQARFVTTVGISLVSPSAVSAS